MKRLIKTLLIVSLITISFSACSKSPAKDASNNTGDFPGNMMPGAENSNSKFGRVTAIDGNKITLALFERPNFQGGSGDASGSKPSRGDRPKGDSPNGSPDNGSSQDNGDGFNNPPGDAKKPDGAPAEGRGSFFNETGETLDITVSNESVIKIRQNRQESEGSLKDITIDSTLTVNYADDGSISEIIVLSSNASADVTPSE